MITTAKRGRPRAFDTDQALGAAASVFWRQGFEGASISELTEAMGISTQSLYAAFGSKEQLYRLALDWYTDNAGEGPARLMAEHDDVVDAVEALLLRAADDFRRRDLPPGCMVSIGALDVSPEHQVVADHLTAIRKARLRRLERRLARAVTDRQLSERVDPRQMARFLTAVVQGMAVQAHDGASRKDLQAIARQAVEHLRGYRVGSGET